MSTFALSSRVRYPARSHRPGGILFVAGAHILLVWMLLALHPTPHTLRAAVPLVVQLLLSEVEPAQVMPAHNPAAPRPAPAAPRPQAAATAEADLVVPIVTARLEPQPTLTAPSASTAPAAAAPPEPAASSAAASAMPASPAALPPPRRQLAASAVQYRVLPPVEVPRAARRAGESGTVWLRVVVDVNGAPVQVSLHRSSGFSRLDEQALWAMRQARFKPHTEDGHAVEVEVVAPIEYPAD